MSRSWDELLRELEHRRQRALGSGGEQGVARERKYGRNTARERIDLLLDSGTFQEVGMLAALKRESRDGSVSETLPSSLVCGFGKVDGRPVAVGAEDYTVAMGPWTGLFLEKSKGIFPGYLEDLAYQWKIPLVVFLQSVGGDVDTPSEAAMNMLASSLSSFPVFNLLSRVPSVTAVMVSQRLYSQASRRSAAA